MRWSNSKVRSGSPFERIGLTLRELEDVALVVVVVVVVVAIKGLLVLELLVLV